MTTEKTNSLNELYKYTLQEISRNPAVTRDNLSAIRFYYRKWIPNSKKQQFLEYVREAFSRYRGLGYYGIDSIYKIDPNTGESEKTEIKEIFNMNPILNLDNFDNYISKHEDFRFYFWLDHMNEKKVQESPELEIKPILHKCQGLGCGCSL